MIRWLQLFCLLAAAQYRPALPGYQFEFPRDHGSHSEYKIEWWYYTGQLRANDGHEFGYELTFFRTGVDRTFDNPSAWNVRELYMAHFAITDISGRKFQYFEKLNRAGPGLAGAAAGGLNTWNTNWFARAQGDEMRIAANVREAAIEFTLNPKKPPIVHGTNGVSQKSEGAGHASHYYSMTRLDTAGTLRLGDKTFQVSGNSWMDHEFGSNQLADGQVGWDWFSIQLDNGVDLMLYRMRNRDGSLDPYSSGTIVDANTAVLHESDFKATPGRLWKSAATGTSYPIEWTISVPSHRGELHIQPQLEAQELVTTRSTGIAYWEGAVSISGVWDGKPVQGRGYLELTGYAEKFRPKI